MIIFIILHKNVCCGNSLEAHWRGASNEYTLHVFGRMANRCVNMYITDQSNYFGSFSLVVVRSLCNPRVLGLISG